MHTYFDQNLTYWKSSTMPSNKNVTSELLLLSLKILFSLFLSHLPRSLSLVFRRLCFSLFLHSFSWRSQILWWEGHLPNTHAGPKLPNEHTCTQAIYKTDTHKNTKNIHRRMNNARTVKPL